VSTPAKRPERAGGLPLPLRGSEWTGRVIALALGLAALPQLSEWLQYDRGALLRGQLWRPLTSHLAHYSWSHLVWNALGFGVVGALCERRQRRRFAWALAVSAVAIPAGLWWAEPELTSYCGLSGATSALFGLLCVTVIRDQIRAGQRGAALISAGLCVGITALLVQTWLTGEALLVSGFGTQVVPVPLAHAIGLGVGIAAAIHPRIAPRVRPLPSRALVTTLGILLAAVPVAARAEGLQRLHSRSATRTTIHVEGPATVHVQVGTTPYPAHPTRVDAVWGVPVAPHAPRSTPARPVGLLPTAALTADRSYAATAQAFDPIVDPLLEATATAVGTAAGTAIGIGLYPPIKVLEHLAGAGQ